MSVALVVAIAYLIGSVSFAIVVSRAMRLPDPRSYGSGNPGATNVLRTGHRAAAVLTLLGDAAKGWVAVKFAEWALALPLDPAGDPAGLPRAALDPVVALAGLAAFVGHLFPVFHRFKGGKGVATAAGVLLGFSVWLGLGTILTWIAIAAFFRLSSLAAVVAAVFAPAFTFWLFGLRAVLGVTIAMSVALLWRHRENISRLLAGTESRIGGGKPAGTGSEESR